MGILSRGTWCRATIYPGKQRQGHLSFVCEQDRSATKDAFSLKEGKEGTMATEAKELQRARIHQGPFSKVQEGYPPCKDRPRFGRGNVSDVGVGGSSVSSR